MKVIRILILIMATISFSCRKPSNDMAEMELYEGPIKVFENVKAVQSDSAKVFLRLTAALHEMYASGDEVFPKGILIELFDEQKNVSTTIRANEGYKYEDDRLVELKGKVVIKSLKNGDELNTEQLFMDQLDGRIYTDVFVTIKSDDEVHTGEGLVSNANFSKYRIIKPQGTIPLDEDF